MTRASLTLDRLPGARAGTPVFRISRLGVKEGCKQRFGEGRLLIEPREHEMDFEGRTVQLDLVGLGIILYSPRWAEGISQRADYLSSNYTTAEQVQAHVQAGTIVGFGTGSPGDYTLTFHSGYPAEAEVRRRQFKLRLGLHCVGGGLCVRDLYDLMDWTPECPPAQTLGLEDGFYHLTLVSDTPPSGYLGDGQVIDIYLERLPAFPDLGNVGVPMLCS